MSGRICHRSARWLRHSNCASRAATRCFASTASTNSQPTSRPTPSDPTETTLFNIATSEPTRQETDSQDITTAEQTSNTPAIPIASYHVSPGTPQPLPKHKIHVLGTDERSRFIAHALSGVYDSVELLGRNPKGRGYTNIETRGRNGTRVETNLAFGDFQDPNAATPQDPRLDKSPIEQLVVTGTASSAIQAIKSVQNRMNKDTTICLLNEGLGVMEEVKDTVLQDAASDSRPSFFLGHMNHKLRFNRSTKSVKQVRPGYTLLAEVDPWSEELQVSRPDLRLPSTSISSSFVAMMQRGHDMNVQASTYDKWLQFKLPAVVFQAVVEPVCVLLDVSYDSLITNSFARRFMETMIREIEEAVSQFPEMQGSHEVQEFLRSDSIRRICYSMINRKKGNPSEMVRLLKKGLETDINYQNGYFLRRAKKLRIKLPLNKLMTQMVLAKSEETKAKLDAYVAIVETSIDSSRNQRI